MLFHVLLRAVALWSFSSVPKRQNPRQNISKNCLLPALATLFQWPNRTNHESLTKFARTGEDIQ
jgi:hypothetical protein